MVSGMMTTYREYGFSLIELMIAMVLGLLLTLGVTQVYLSSSDTYRLTNGLARIQENARFAADMLGRDIREAGGNGCLLEIGTVTDIRQSPSDPNTTGILGWEYSDTGQGDSYTLTGNVPGGETDWDNNNGDALPGSISGEVVEGSDILFVEGAHAHDLNGNTVTGLGGGAINLSGSTGIERDTVIHVTSEDCSNSRIFYKNNAASASSIVAGGSDNQTGGTVPAITDPPMTNNLTVSVYRATAFYIGENPDGNPALYSQSLEEPTPPPPQELLSNVENMQILYGEGGPAGATTYVTAENVTDWSSVVSVRLGLLMRSDANVMEESQTRAFNMLETEVNTPADDRVRLVLMKTIGLRNRLE